MADRRLGITLPLDGASSAEALTSTARFIEENGFTDVWTAEVGGNDAFSPLAAVAVATNSVRLGTAIVPAYSRPPALLAMSAATLQALSGGRFCLGIGTSTPIIVGNWMGLTFDHPLQRMKETVEIVRKALDEKKVTYEGKTVTAKSFRLTQDPGSRVPIYIAALGPKMLELAGQVADGVIFFLVTPEGVSEMVGKVRDAATAAGRDPDEIDVVARLIVGLGQSRDDLRPIFRRFTTSYAMTDAYKNSLARQGFAEEAELIAKRWRDGDRDGATEAVTDEMIDRIYLFGSVDECRQGLQKFRDAGLKTPVLMPLSFAQGEDRLGSLQRSLAEIAMT